MRGPRKTEPINPHARAIKDNARLYLVSRIMSCQRVLSTIRMHNFIVVKEESL